jgi:hypothetical protein
MLTVALTVFIYGAVLAGALLTCYGCVYLDALTKRTQAQAQSERTLHH